MSSRLISDGRRRSPRRDQRGASAVEFALVLPFLLLIVFGIIVYGMVFAQSLSLGNAARQAARSAVIDGTTCAQIIQTTQDAAGTIGMSGTDPTVTITRGADEASAKSNPVCVGGTGNPPCKGTAAGTNVYVTLNYSPTTILPLVPMPSKLTGKGVYRCEFS